MTWLRVGDAGGTNYERTSSLAPKASFTAVLHATGTQPDPELDEKEEPWPARPSSA